MKETEKIEAMLKHGLENGMNTDEWIVALLSSIACSLAIIADKVIADKTEGENG